MTVVAQPVYETRGKFITISDDVRDSINRTVA